MNLVKVILLSAFVVLSCIHLTSSASCFCTNKDEVSLFEDKELTIVATTISKSKTCFIGTKMDEEDNPIDESSIRIQELSFGRCGDDQQGMHFENVFTNENIFASLASSYIGTYDDFFEIPLKDFNKRFLTEGFLGYGVWSPWSNWGSCNASSCTDTGTTVRYRWCGNNSTTCPGPEKESLECSISCSTGVVVGWSGWMPWTECGSYDCLYELTSRKRLCLADNSSCVGASEIWRLCSQDLCAVDGSWTEWSTWSGCSGQIGVLTRKRSCTNPPPSTNGKECEGNFWSIKKCPDVIEWTDWERWTTCRYTSSDVYIQLRNRSCTIEDSVDKENSTCHEHDRLSYRTCQFYGTWNTWSAWSSCSSSLSQGDKTRSRTCNITTAVDHSCIGNATEKVLCTDQNVILPTEWTQWTDCLLPCNGLSHRNRTCTDTDPSNCTGIEEIRQCSEDICIVDGNWAEWSEWYNCTKSDQISVRTRNRTCTDPPPQNGGDSCFGGASTDVTLCNREAEWGNWQAWQQCLPIGGNDGVRFRYRHCHYGISNNYHCEGIDFDRKLCQIHALWNEWGGWSACSVSCESGVLTRSRSCPTKDGLKYCIGEDTDNKTCITNPHCPVDGSYTTWSEWSACPVSCGPGALYRTRYCTNPSPQFGGKNCSHLGTTVEASFCDIACPVDGHWGSWLAWGNCSATCDYGVKVRVRNCDSPPAANGGYPCEGVNTSTENCSLPLCSIDGNWGQWSNWSQCSCDHTHIRHRDCNNPTPQGGGQYCAGKATEKESCLPNPLLACPVNGGWSEWFNWSFRCSVTCDQGVTKRIRQCSNPVPANGGTYCKGSLFEEKPCIESPCPFDGMFATWSRWGGCSVTCGSGTQERNRLCNPPPMYGGANCTGDYQEHKTCVQNPCPIDGHWSDWGSWSNWDKSCSFATRVRSRFCDSPPPQYHGRICMGEFNDTESTDLGNCPVDGNWGQWSDWSACSCHNTRIRHRDCNNPTPVGIGKYCDGNNTNTENCQQSSPQQCPVNGGWSEWLEWSSRCSVTCGQGVTKRFRQCANPIPSHGGEYCKGDLFEERQCIESPCPVDGVWGLWESWTACSVTCEEGTHSRSRICDSPSPQFNGNYCVGNATDVSPCIDRPSCIIDGVWAIWSSWFGCSTTCGYGENTRYRTCSNPRPQNGGKPCPGTFADTTNCRMAECPVDGQWTDWSAWNECSVTCQNGTQARSRNCTAPAPQFGGKVCQGGLHEFRPCAKSPCPIDGMWGVWSQWFECSTTCGPGTITRNRTCDNPQPQYGGSTCLGKFIDTTNCSVVDCPVDGQWTDWGAWNECSVTCQNGTQARSRNCTAPAPQFGGKDCQGGLHEFRPCAKSPCPINGEWGEWLEWSSRCSATCGQGVTKRYRLCSNPIPMHGGEYCAGNLFEEKHCSEALCPVDGQWGQWSDWSTCSCHNTRVRHRDCNNPAPVGIGKYCDGNDTDTENCQQSSPQPCPVNGGWSEWLEWSSRCSVTCGQGVTKRFRQCANPIPAHGGEYCKGDLFEERQCIESPCPDGYHHNTFHMLCGNIIISSIHCVNFMFLY